MCTSDGSARLPSRLAGFTVVELLVGITLAVLLALGAAPLVLSLQTVSVVEGDRTVAALQGRVAAARLERDLRLASAAESPFWCEGPILEASTLQVVFLGRTGGSSETVLIEWELAGTSLMRRWGACPGYLPTRFAHTLFSDSKTMVAGLAPGARFTYVVGGQEISAGIAPADLRRVDTVTLHGEGRDVQGRWPWLISAKAKVGM